DLAPHDLRQGRRRIERGRARVTDDPRFRPVTFTAEGVEGAGRHLAGTGVALPPRAGGPAVVMAHGLGGTMDSGLAPFALGLGAAGLDVLMFDYRGLARSRGTPPQTVSAGRQRADYDAPLGAAARLPGVDPRRLVLWGVSLSGGHVVAAPAPREGGAGAVAPPPLGELGAAPHRRWGTGGPPVAWPHATPGPRRCCAPPPPVSGAGSAGA